jgi:hypothetical protein
LVCIFGLRLRTFNPYRTFPDEFGAHLFSAVLRVQIALDIPNAPRTRRFEAIIDSGATRCIFHAGIAEFLGIDVRSGDCELTNGIGGEEEVWIHPVTLYIPRGPVHIRAGFKENLPLAGLLGMSGFFDHFNVTFESLARQCVLERIYRA